MRLQIAELMSHARRATGTQARTMKMLFVLYSYAMRHALCLPAGRQALCYFQITNWRLKGWHFLFSIGKEHAMKVPETMKAAVLYGPNDLRVTEKKVPQPGYQEALLKVELVPFVAQTRRSWLMDGRTSLLLASISRGTNTQARSLPWEKGL